MSDCYAPPRRDPLADPFPSRVHLRDPEQLNALKQLRISVYLSRVKDDPTPSILTPIPVSAIFHKPESEIFLMDPRVWEYDATERIGSILCDPCGIEMRWLKMMNIENS